VTSQGHDILQRQIAGKCYKIELQAYITRYLQWQWYLQWSIDLPFSLTDANFEGTRYANLFFEI